MKSASGTARKGAQEAHASGKGYLALLPFAVLSVGHVLHTWVATSLLSAANAGAGLALAGVALTVITWLYARPRGPLVQWHASVTSGAVAVQMFALMVAGVSWPSTWTVLGLSGLLALTWTVRRMPAIRGEGDGQSEPQTFGLSIRSKRTVVDSADRAEVKLRLGNGQTVEDVQKQLGAIGSTFDTIRKGTRATAGAREGEVTLSLAYRDVLAETLPWRGPSHPGGSIADGWFHGLAEDSHEVWTYPAGNYAKNIAPGHVGLSGMPRSGKGACAHVAIAETSTRRDVAKVLLVDTSKGEQFTRAISGAIGWYADDEMKAKRMLSAVERAVVARNKALGQAGHTSWTPAAYDDPALRMPYLLLWLEEASAYLDLFVRTMVGLGEKSLSSGTGIVVSAQLWKHDRIPTSLRSSFGNVLVFGQASSEDASYLLSDSTTAGGADPGEWKTRHPGRFLREANGVDVERFAVPNKHFFDPGDLLSQVTSTYGPMMAPYDPVTLEAFGDAFEPFGGVVSVTGTEIVPTEEELPEEKAGMYVLPKMDDEELDARMAEIDPRAPEPAWTGEGVDMRPVEDADARTWTEGEKEEEWHAMLAALAGAGRTEVRTAELHEEWAKRVGEREASKRYHLHELLNVWMDAGMVERVTDGNGDPIRGRYRIGTLARVAHSE